MHWLANRFESALAKTADEEEDRFGAAFRGSWTEEERRAVAARLAKLPPQLTRFNPNFKAVERAKVLSPKPPGAPGDSKFIGPKDPQKPGTVVLYDKGVYDGGRRIDKQHLSRSVFHELAHSLDDELPKVFTQWKAISGWSEKNGKWVALRPAAGFVDDYAKTSPFEDWAETFQEYFIKPEAVRKVAPEKFRFVVRFLGAARRGEIKALSKEKSR